MRVFIRWTIKVETARRNLDEITILKRSNVWSKNAHIPHITITLADSGAIDSDAL